MHRFGKHFTVTIVPVLKDNYSYVVQCCATQQLAVVDVSETAPVVAALTAQLPDDAKGVLDASRFCIWTTHKHWDHAGGNKDMAASFAGLRIHGGAADAIPACTDAHVDGDAFALGELVVNVLHTPCHTRGHVLYHVSHKDDTEHGALFSGDTLFVGGIGAFFEGNAQMMVDAMRKIATLPAPTRVYPGHEYTMNFLDFAKTVDAENATLAEWTAKFAAARKAGEPAVGSSLEAEQAGLNPFMRAALGDEALMKKTGISDPVKLMQHLYDTCP